MLDDETFMRYIKSKVKNGLYNYRDFIISIISATPQINDTAIMYRCIEEFSDFDIPRINCDINCLTEDKLKEVLDDNKIDLIVGGLPCQSYSTLGKRQIDERTNLFMQYKRVLGILKPNAFVFEKVTGILSMVY